MRTERSTIACPAMLTGSHSSADSRLFREGRLGIEGSQEGEKVVEIGAGRLRMFWRDQRADVLIVTRSIVTALDSTLMHDCLLPRP